MESTFSGLVSYLWSMSHKEKNANTLPSCKRQLAKMLSVALWCFTSKVANCSHKILHIHSALCLLLFSKFWLCNLACQIDAVQIVTFFSWHCDKLFIYNKCGTFCCFTWLHYWEVYVLCLSSGQACSKSNSSYLWKQKYSCASFNYNWWLGMENKAIMF